MTALTLIRLHDVPPQPWRNGGGSTRQLFAWPADGPWHARISVADIDRDGPFSAYPGIDRWFVVLQGAGVQLALPHGPVTLRQGSRPLNFGGEAAPGCTLLGGPTRDLNLMLRRGQNGAGSIGSIQPVVLDQPCASPAPLRALFCADTVALHIDGAPAQPMSAWTLAVSTGARHPRWWVTASDPAARAWWITCAPAATPAPA